MSRFAEHISRLVASVSGSHGRTDVRLRRAVRDRVRSIADGEMPPHARDLPDDLARYVDTISRHAFKVTDSQIERLQQAGYPEDVLFDVTVNAAVSAGLARLDRGLALLKEPH
jgi:hypothetical protein